jgi:hypothetical protein
MFPHLAERLEQELAPVSPVDQVQETANSLLIITGRFAQVEY